MAFRTYNDSCYVMWFRKARSFPHLEVSFWCKFWNGDTKVLEPTNYKERYLLNALSAKFTTKVVLESAQNITLPREVLHSNNGFCFFLLLFNFISQVYPGRDITNIVESSHYQKIGGWCRQGALNAAKCKGAQRWIKPFRCLGKCQSENEKQNATVNDSTVNEHYFCDDFPFLKVFDFGN